jgi:hypothetical protein
MTMRPCIGKIPVRWYHSTSNARVREQWYELGRRGHGNCPGRSGLPVGCWGSTAPNARRAAQGRVQLTCRDHRSQALTWWQVHYVRRRDPLRHVLLIIGVPGHLARINAVLRLEDTAGPDASGDRVGSHPEFFAYQVPGFFNTRSHIADDRAVVEVTGEKHGNSRKLLVECLGTQIGSGGKLANVERQVAHHPAVGGDLRLHFDLVELQTVHGNVTAQERQGAAV